MQELARAGLGIVLVTHHVSEIIPEMERVVLLQRGHVAADGPKRASAHQRAAILVIWSAGATVP
jgi:ABC-type sugar transport system ATPase subunit